MRKKKIKVKKTTQIGELLRINPNVANVLLGFGLHCLSCPMSQLETIEEACMVHDVDADFVVEKINEFLNQ
ncbi:MAG: DUF1858 domain-containing protein [Clostridia bacterium]|nr:DUF1858 domain-containing protein [Clostridia bacterium]